MTKRLNKNCICLIVFVTAMISLCGCEKKKEATPTSPQPAKQVAIQPQIVIQKQVTTAKITISAAQTLDFKSKKDPFKPLLTPVPPTSKNVREKTKITDALPIQSYDTEKFIVSGIIIGLKQNQALLIDPVGKGYVVKAGMLIGNNGGHISKITASTVEVVEQYQDEKRQVRTRKIALPLAKKGKETPR